MKKYFILFTMAVVAISMISCAEESQKDEVVLEAYDSEMYANYVEMMSIVEEDEAFAELNEQLLLLAQEYPTEIVCPRASVRVWLRSIVLGDIIGACIGGGTTWNPVSIVLGAVFGSIKAAIIVARQDNGERYRPRRQSLDPNVNTNTIQGSAEYSGYMHNIIVNDTFDELGAYVYQYNDDTIVTCIADKAYERMRISATEYLSFITNYDQRNRITDLINLYDSVPSIQLMDMIVEQYPSRRNEIESVSIFCNQYTGYEYQATKDSYTQAYLNTVRQSNISTESKDYIISVVQIANYSDKMWEVDEN